MLTVETKLDRSSIHGIGVFSEEFIPAGCVLWMWHDGIDQIIDPSLVESLPLKCQSVFKRYTWVESDGLYRAGFDNERYINHSNDPNCLFLTSTEGTEFGIASRDIQVGDEITQDYSHFDINFGNPEYGYDW